MKTTAKILIGILIIGLIVVCGCGKQITPPTLLGEDGDSEETSNETPSAGDISESDNILQPPALPTD